ncbi:hypothetical protein ACHAXR_006730 [Thalassiosira sp. AJA248-18]
MSTIRRHYCTSAFLLVSTAATSVYPRAFLSSSLALIPPPAVHSNTKNNRPVHPFVGSSFFFPSVSPSTARLGTRTSLKMSSSSSSQNNLPTMKRAKLTHLTPSTKIIGTHSGTFQADEALGVWLLRQLPAYRHSPVVRSRDTSVLDTCDIVIDVGGTYDHSKLRYDHHQRGYDERFNDDTTRCTKLSASGLVYRHYGKEVIGEYYPALSSSSTTTELLDWVYKKMYGSFMEAIDAIDTGVEPIPSSAKDADGEEIELQYHDSTGLSSRVGRVNPRWNEVDDNGAAPDPDARFEIASKMCGEDFLSVLTKIVESDLPARSIVETAVKNRYECDTSGEIICLPSGGLPWKSQVYELEKDYELSDVPIKYVLYTDQAGMWRIQCVSVEGKAFENRLSLPAEWRGVRDEDLSDVAGIAGCTFCHASGFIGGNKSYEGVLEMARVALKVGKGSD